ncbi:hypothetical protein MYCTH_2296673 [Thermothelomyces thermophilus ATCC 42464]|uniref:Nitrogen permease regulator 3 n=1 Tax=Thermothelomyces thermophilus (strain ATCC 42464 / BCRC 31852 / DSM 1799) TaxID=573729 RepID=G2Q2E7_THET4|nr:uncharacterized protein MYCTH_2296673 [Thermothelomyces thermophilus ATCC 42464]AEO54272.1 hypothetical protein MYCTH_2296673 [Thermothelomyces thermophilus ATCC 42464]
MQDLYEAVSQNRIAALQLDTAEGTVTHSVQIPVPFHVSDLPPEGHDSQRGLWLTTANSLMAEEAAETPGFLDKNFALLLMMDEKRVIAELQTDPDETTLAMIEFVRHCKPTLSFYQVCQQSSNILTPNQVRKFAQHFIFWRRAIAIPPLHARDMYIVSPNCDLRKLPQAAAQWARQFPLSPSLPNFLAELSVAPRPYKLHCPSKAHRPVYMAMLAWLMRGGWVTQLCTFAYVVVWPEIIYEVEYALEAEEIARAKRAQAMGREPGSLESDDTTTTTTTAATMSAVPSPGATAPDDQAMAGSASGFLPLLSDLTDPTRSTTASLSHSQSSLIPTASTPVSPAYTRTNAVTSSHSPSPPPPTPPPPPPPHDDNDNDYRHDRDHQHDDNGNNEPTPAEQAAEKARLARLADRTARQLAERATAHARKAVPQATEHPSVNHAPHLEGITPHIILDAKKATGKESLYLSAIERRFRDKARKNRGVGKSDGAFGDAGLRQGGSDRSHDDRNWERDPALKGKEDKGGRDAAATTAPGARGTNRFGMPPSSAAATTSSSIRDTGDWDERVANAWPVMCKYFNGRSALERIALQEDMKRKDVWNLLTAMSEYLLCVRHW